MRIAVFLGSSPGPDHHRAAAAGLGSAIAEAGHGLVYGGAHVGLMGVLADAALAAGGEVVGVLPQNLERELRVVTSPTDLLAGLVTGTPTGS